MRARHWLLPLLAMTTYAGGAWAQEVGSRVRVRQDTTEVIGTLIRLDTDSIVIRTDVAFYRQGKLVNEEVVVPVTVDTKLDVSLGRGSDGGKGALIGGGVGLGLAAVLTAIGGNQSENSFVSFSQGEVFAILSVLFVVPGSLIGFAIGSGNEWETWETVPLDRPPQGEPYEVTEGMVRLGLRIDF